MIFGCIVEALVGLLCIVLGILLWKKQMLSILHDYHYKNVRRRDIPAYTRQVGIGLILVGSGILITGVLNLFYSPYWWIPLVIGIGSGLIVMYIAQRNIMAQCLAEDRKR